jgi:hypothetical protein
MRTKIKKMAKISGKALVLMAAFLFLVGGQVWASNQSTFNQTISAGSLSVDIVDAGGTTVASPAITMGAETFSFSTQDATGQFGTSTERVRAYNPTTTETWSVNLAASDPTDTWTGGSGDYDFNDAGGYTDDGATTDADAYGGQMTVNPSTGSITGVSGCATTNVNKGTSDSFVEGSVNSIDIMTAASGAATSCRWDFIGAADNITQKLPASQAAGSYSITMVLSIS